MSEKRTPQRAPGPRHTCHATGCEIEIPARMLMCRRHWGMVPLALQRAVWRHYRRGQETDKRPTRENLAAARAAIDAVAEREGRRVSAEVRPIGRDEANAFVSRWHRHNARVKGHKFAIAAVVGGEVVGVVIVGRPSARELDDGRTFEVTRLCTCEGAPGNVASTLLGAAWRSAAAMGIERLVSYTRADEHGTCYRAAGWRRDARVRARAWSRAARPAPMLPGLESPAAEVVERIRWEKRA